MNYNGDEDFVAVEDDGREDDLYFRVHWAWFVVHAFQPLLLFIGWSVFCTAGINGNWPIFATEHAGLVVFLVFLVLVLWTLYIFLDWANDIYIIGSDEVKDVHRQPFTKEQISIARMQKIQSVQYKKDGLIQVLLDYGTVYITVGEAELTFDYVPHPEEVQQLILERVDQWNKNAVDEQEKRQQAYISGLVDAIRKPD